MSDRVGRPTEAVQDSGLWQHLDVDELSLSDAAVLVASVSDNLAANALLDVVGPDAVAQAAQALGCQQSRLADRIRDVRTAEHPPAPSIGRADELAEAARRIELAGTTSKAAATVRSWLLTGVDLSMVGSAFGLDPLAHVTPDRGVLLWNKTGTDTTIRADVGVLRGPDHWFAYAALAEWNSTDDARDAALERMRDLGHHLRTLVQGR
ncbi:MAG: serine hydrolase, partial [Candidatus Nanopelagicales bacterium]